MILHDPNYDLVEYHPLPKKRGQQCGKCGMKFEYDKSYGYWCAEIDCPMGYGSSPVFSEENNPSGC